MHVFCLHSVQTLFHCSHGCDKGVTLCNFYLSLYYVLGKCNNEMHRDQIAVLVRQVYQITRISMLLRNRSSYFTIIYVTQPLLLISCDAQL